MIIYVLGTVLKLTGGFLFIPVICSLIYHEQEGLPFLVTGLFSVGLGILATLHKPENTMFFLREGCIATALSWILLSVVGAVPFFLTGEIPSFLDALFETVSGFTTTGASILPDVEAMSKTALLWRSFTHWIGWQAGSKNSLYCPHSLRDLYGSDGFHACYPYYIRNASV